MATISSKLSKFKSPVSTGKNPLSGWCGTGTGFWKNTYKKKKNSGKIEKLKKYRMRKNWGKNGKLEKKRENWKKSKKW